MCSRPAGLRGLLEDRIQRGEPSVLAGLWRLQESIQQHGNGGCCQKDLQRVCRSRCTQTGMAFMKGVEIEGEAVHLKSNSAVSCYSIVHFYNELYLSNNVWWQIWTQKWNKKMVFSEQVNIDSVTRREIIENLSQPGPNCFDSAQRLIYGLMENDCYPRFLKSEIYQALLEAQWKNTKGKKRSLSGGAPSD